MLLYEDFTPLFNDFKVWYNLNNGKIVPVPSHAVHMDVLMKEKELFDHNESWNSMKALEIAKNNGWTRIGVENINGKIITFVQANSLKDCLTAARWLRKENHEEWDILEINTFDYKTSHEFVGENNIEMFLKYGKTPAKV